MNRVASHPLPDSWSFHNHRQRFSSSDTEPARPRRASRASMAWSRVVRMRAPVAPIGWPSATAPPLTLTLLWSSPNSRLIARETAEKASLISNRSMSPIDKAGLLEHQLDRLDRRNRKPLRRECRSGIADDARHRREPEMRGLLFSHDDQRCRPVVTGGRIAHGQDTRLPGTPA